MAKKKVEKKRREPTKRQLSRWQQAEKRRRLILYAGILVVVAVLGVIGGGVYNNWYVADYKPLHETVIEVNGTKFNMQYYINMLQYYGMNKSMEEVAGIADTVIETIERNEVIEQEAEKMGYFITDDEVALALEGSNLPLKKDFWDPIRAEMLGKLLREAYFDKQVPTQAEQRQILAMFLESEAKVDEVKARLEAGEDFVKLAGELSLDTIAKEKSGDFGWRPEGVLTQFLGTPVIDEFAFSAEEGEVSPPLADSETQKKAGYWLVKVLERNEAGEPHVHCILLGSEEQAKEIKARAEAGEDFDTLQGEYTLDQTLRCLYWPKPEEVNPAIRDYAFNKDIELNTISEPLRDDTISTKGGYWLVKVAGVESVKDITTEDRDYLKFAALDEWADSLMTDANNSVVSYLDEDKKNWALAEVFWG